MARRILPIGIGVAGSALLSCAALLGLPDPGLDEGLAGDAAMETGDAGRDGPNPTDAGVPDVAEGGRFQQVLDGVYWLDLATAPNGNAVAAFVLDAPTTLMGETFTPPAGGTIAILVGYLPDGRARWVKKLGDPDPINGSIRVLVDANGFSVVQFVTREAIDLGGGVVLGAPAPGYQETIIARFDSEGRPRWIRGLDTALKLAAMSKLAVFVAGDVPQTVNLIRPSAGGGTSLTPLFSKDDGGAATTGYVSLDVTAGDTLLDKGTATSDYVGGPRLQFVECSDSTTACFGLVTGSGKLLGFVEANFGPGFGTVLGTLIGGKLTSAKVLPGAASSGAARAGEATVIITSVNAPTVVDNVTVRPGLGVLALETNRAKAWFTLTTSGSEARATLLSLAALAPRDSFAVAGQYTNGSVGTAQGARTPPSVASGYFVARVQSDGGGGGILGFPDNQAGVEIVPHGTGHVLAFGTFSGSDVDVGFGKVTSADLGSRRSAFIVDLSVP